MVTKGEESWGGKDWECGISRCKPLYIGWVNNKILLYSTGNYIQYPVINHNGKEYLKKKKREREREMAVVEVLRDPGGQNPFTHPSLIWAQRLLICMAKLLSNLHSCQRTTNPEQHRPERPRPPHEPANHLTHGGVHRAVKRHARVFEAPRSQQHQHPLGTC